MGELQITMEHTFWIKIGNVIFFALFKKIYIDRVIYETAQRNVANPYTKHFVQYRRGFAALLQHWNIQRRVPA